MDLPKDVFDERGGLKIHPAKLRQALLQNEKFQQLFAEKFPDVFKKFKDQENCRDRFQVCSMFVREQAPAELSWLGNNMPVVAAISIPFSPQAMMEKLTSIETKVLEIWAFLRQNNKD